MVAWIGNEICRQGNKRKATEKELKIVARVMHRVHLHLEGQFYFQRQKI